MILPTKLTIVFYSGYGRSKAKHSIVPATLKKFANFGELCGCRVNAGRGNSGGIASAKWCILTLSSVGRDRLEGEGSYPENFPFNVSQEASYGVGKGIGIE